MVVVATCKHSHMDYESVACDLYACVGINAYSLSAGENSKFLLWSLNLSSGVPSS